MRRLAHFTFNVLTALSLVLCVAMAACWVDSRRHGREFVHFRPIMESGRLQQTRDYFMSEGGTFTWIRWRDPNYAQSKTADTEPFSAYIADEDLGWAWVPQADGVTPTRYISLLGLGYERATAFHEQYARLNVPYLFLVAATMLLIGVRLRSFLIDARVRRWLRSGRCAKCGYDLRAASGRCPECGTAVPANTR